MPGIRSILEYALILAVAYVLVISPLLTILIPSWSSSHSFNSNSSITFDKVFLPPINLSCPSHSYTTTVLSRSPLIIYIHDFLSASEQQHLLAVSEKHWTPSPVYSGGSEPTVDLSVRNSSRAPLDPEDTTVGCIAKRAMSFQGWPKDTFIERMWTQRYEAGGHYGGHFDWAGDLRQKRGRVSTFMVYVGCEGCVRGGTTFPRLSRDAVGEAWCDMVECDPAEPEGITFKPVPGNAIYWENFRSDGKGWEELWHMADKVVEGEKVGLNIWSWYQDGYGSIFEKQQKLSKFYEEQPTSDEL